MKFELLEVAGTHIFSMKAMTLVLFFIFAIIVVGYLVGKISIKGVSLGSAAIFLVALVAGHFKGVAFQDIASWQESLPAFAAAQEAVGEANPLYGNVAVGYAIAYPFGVIGVVLFVQIIPKILHANMDEERAKLVSIQSNDAVGGKQKKLFEMDKFGIAAFFLAVMLGLILGSFHIPLGKGSFNLGTTGGPLIIGLIFGHFGRIGKLSLKVDQHVLSLFQELGLILFLIGAGMDGGAEFVAVLKEYGALLFLWGALMTLIPMIVGFLFAKYVLKLSLFNNLGSICGGMTSTPALGTLIKTANTPNVASAYAATYPIALILVVLLAQFLTRL